jgi:hypothetical protein
MRFKKFKSLKKFLRRKKSIRMTRTIGAGILGVVGVGVMAVAILVAARQPSPASMAYIRTSSAQPQREAGAPATKKALTQFETKNTALKVPGQPGEVSITGCLERDAERFRLQNTSGADAPKSRSWKSGFLKKRAVSIEVVDADDSLQLSNQVGQRVSVVGVLVDREMRARSLQPVAGDCAD